MKELLLNMDLEQTGMRKSLDKESTGSKASEEKTHFQTQELKFVSRTELHRA